MDDLRLRGYQRELIERFEAALPERPPWETGGDPK